MDTSQFSSYSETEQKAIVQIAENNNNFYNQFGIADLPFIEMEVHTEDNIIAIKPFVSVGISLNDSSYEVTLRKSSEQKCWFFSVSNGTEIYNGIVHYNTILNWDGMFAVAILNSNEGKSFEDITNTIQYSNFMILEK